MAQNKINLSDKIIGGNIIIDGFENNKFKLRPDNRDSKNWFYWSFSVSGAQEKTLTFEFDNRWRIGYFGPAVSHDLVHWHWLGSHNDFNSFSYEFSKEETLVYFAHNIPYYPIHLEIFAKKHSLTIEELCLSDKGRSVPCFKFGKGDKKIILTARHHACEATGNYNMEGFIEYFLSNPFEGYEFLCVPFVDYDGVIDGDQGKERFPHDHNRDYFPDQPALYNTVRAIKEYAQNNNVIFAFDFHSPWHLGGSHDTCYIVHSNKEIAHQLNLMGEILQKNILEGSFKYYHDNDMPVGKEWNTGCIGSFAQYMTTLKNTNLAFSFELPYFGTPDNPYSNDRANLLGKSFAKALVEYIKTRL